MLLFERDGAKIYSDDIEDLIEQYCQELKIDDLTKEGQRRFKYILSQIGKRLFPNVLTRDTYGVRTYKQQPLYYYCNDDTYMALCIYYIDLCMKYNKLISIEGYCYLCNIDFTTCMRWKDSEPNSVHYHTWEMLNQKREQVLSDACFDTSGPIGKLGVANHEFKWTQPQIVKEQRINILTADSLPILSAISEQQQFTISEQPKQCEAVPMLSKSLEK